MKKHIRYFLAAFLATVAGVGVAATFNLFQPAAGILKGNPSTYVTTAAASTDVISLWSGTCSAASFLRGDGACAPVTTSPGGTTSQVQFNNAGAFGGDNGLTYELGSDMLIAHALTVDLGISAPVLSSGSSLALSSTGANDVSISTDGNLRLSITDVGEWLVGGTIGTAGQVLSSNGPGAVPTWEDAAGGSPPGGTTNNVQYNDGAGGFAGEAGFNYNPTTEVLGLAGGLDVEAGGIIQLNGVNVCLQSGTNCPSGGGPTLGGTNTWTGNNFYQTADPKIIFDETDAPANEGAWLARSSAGIFALSTASDADPLTAVSNAVTIDRNGTTVTNINLQATAVQVGGNPIVTTQGSGVQTTRLTWARVSTVSGTTCNIVQGSGFSGCTRITTGAYTLAASSSMSNNSACTVSSGDSVTKIAIMTGASFSGPSVNFYNDSFATSDPGNFHVTCMSPN